MEKAIIGIVLIVLLYALMNVFIARNLAKIALAFLPKLRPWVIYVLYSLLLLVSMAYFIALACAARGIDISVRVMRICSAITYVWLGIFLYLFMSLALYRLALLVLRIVPSVSYPLSLRVRRITGGLAILLALGVSVYGLVHAAQVKTVHYDVTLKGLREEYQVVLISDLHLGAPGSEARLKKTVNKINAIRPDLVLIAGDIMDGNFEMVISPEEDAALLRSMQAPCGVYACLGNHDSGATVPQLLSFLEDSNITLLREESTLINDRLVLLGRADQRPIGGTSGRHREKTETVLDALPKGFPTIVLDHNPEHIGDYRNVDLILCGHTHKGQLFPANLVTHFLYEADYGYYQKNEAAPQVIVTSGAGLWGMPLRVGSDCEIVSITLHAAE